MAEKTSLREFQLLCHLKSVGMEDPIPESGIEAASPFAQRLASFLARSQEAKDAAPEPDRRLLEAAGRGDFRGLEAALRDGANPNARDGDKEAPTALMIASLEGFREGIGMLWRWGADLNATDWQGWTALHHAASMGREDVCEDLKAAGADEGIVADGGKLAGDFLAPKAPRGIPRKLH